MQTGVSRWAIRGLYVLALILFFVPLVELFTTTWPFRFGDVSWRYAAFGITANYIYQSAAGLALLMAVGYWQGRRGWMRVSSLVALVMAGLTIAVMAWFAVELPAAVELRGEERRTGTLIGGTIQELKFLATLLLLVFLGWGAREMSRSGQGGQRGRAPGSPSALRASTPPDAVPSGTRRAERRT